MRLLHTSDWHLGRSFHQVGLLGAQATALDQLVGIVREERIGAVLVSGDVYDRALPSPDAVHLLDETLLRIVDAGAQVVVSSGNHDSAVRLGFAAALLERSGVHLRTGLAGLARPVAIGDVAVYPVPYLEPSLVADRLGAVERTHAAVLRAALDACRETRPGARHSVVMAHAFASGGVGSESERDISVGGVAAVPLEVFDGFSYVALGHLHRRQRLSPSVHYSGSPVAMSFAEAGHRKGSLIVDLSGDVPAVEFVEAPVERPIAVLRGTLATLLTDPRHAPAERAWCQVTLTDQVRPVGAMDRVRRRFPNTLELRFEPENAGTAAPRTYAARVARRSEIEVCCDFLGHVRDGRQASLDERALLREAFEAARVERAIREGEGEPAGPARAGASRSRAAGAEDAA